MLTTTTDWNAYAERLNATLAAGGVVLVSTMTAVKQYAKRNAGDFTSDGRNLYVRYGKVRNCLTSGQTLLVGLRAGFMRTPENVDRDNRLTSLGYNLEATKVVGSPCHECGYDRRAQAGRTCAFCGHFA